jgi:hypothetical protein
MRDSCKNRLFILGWTFILMSMPASAQWKPTPNDTLVSYRILPDHRVDFKIYAPNANKVMLNGTDIPGIGQGAEMTKMENGVWHVVVGTVSPGGYRYNFNVDGVFVIDPRNPLTSQSNMNAWSLVYVDGADFMDTKDVPHGAIAEMTYYSNSLRRFRRLHVYTPPGYESGKGQFPIFYLLHGAFDCDDSWTTVGRAGFILDNLIAQKQAKPMVVVMPAGHTAPFRFGGPRPEVDELKKELKLLWFATGKEDFLLETSRVTVEMLKKHKFDVIYQESKGGHTWINWRNYLYEFAQLLF